VAQPNAVIYDARTLHSSPESAEGVVYLLALLVTPKSNRAGLCGLGGCV